MPRGRPRNPAGPTPAAQRRRANNRPQVPFAYKLVLNQWLLSLFNVKRFEHLAEHLRQEKLEGLDENNVHHFHHALTAQLFNLTQLPTDLLLEYDQNIVKHTLRLNERRITRGEEPIAWKYFQYLTLLFTEIYLDRYFRDPQGLLKVLNAQVAATNLDKPEADLERDCFGRSRLGIPKSGAFLIQHAGWAKGAGMNGKTLFDGSSRAGCCGGRERGAVAA